MDQQGQSRPLRRMASILSSENNSEHHLHQGHEGGKNHLEGKEEYQHHRQLFSRPSVDDIARIGSNRPMNSSDKTGWRGNKVLPVGCLDTLKPASTPLPVGEKSCFTTVVLLFITFHVDCTQPSHPQFFFSCFDHLFNHFFCNIMLSSPLLLLLLHTHTNIYGYLLYLHNCPSLEAFLPDPLG